jgi:hypothetical protein
MILNESEVRLYLSNAGFKGTALNYAVKICECESSFNTNAHNQNFEDSRGLMQINLDAHPEYNSLDLFDPNINTQIAFILYTDAGNSFKDWTCARILGLLNPKIPFYITLAFGVGIVLYSLS